MNTLDNLIRLRWVRTALAAFGLAAALATAMPAGVEAQRSSASEAAQPDGVVNIQTATVDQLRLLPGIGPSKAEAIVSHRERRAFRRVEDLMRVRGIGRATFRRLRSMLTVDGPTTMAGPQRAASASE